MLAVTALVVLLPASVQSQGGTVVAAGRPQHVLSSRRPRDRVSRRRTPAWHRPGRDRLELGLPLPRRRRPAPLDDCSGRGPPRCVLGSTHRRRTDAPAHRTPRRHRGPPRTHPACQRENRCGAGCGWAAAQRRSGRWSVHHARGHGWPGRRAARAHDGLPRRRRPGLAGRPPRWRERDPAARPPVLRELVPAARLSDPQPFGGRAGAGDGLPLGRARAARGIDAYPGRTIFTAPELISAPSAPGSMGEATIAVDPDTDRAIAAWQAPGGAIDYSLRALGGG